MWYSSIGMYVCIYLGSCIRSGMEWWVFIEIEEDVEFFYTYRLDVTACSFIRSFVRSFLPSIFHIIRYLHVVRMNDWVDG